MDYKLSKNIAIFFIVFLLFIFSINLIYLHLGGSNRSAKRNNSARYVYSPSDIQAMLEKDSLSNFSGINSYPWVADKIEEVHLELLRNNCSVPAMAEMFYKDNITLLSPTLTYMEYGMFKCLGRSVALSERINAKVALDSYKEQFIREDAAELSPQRALGELLIYWQMSGIGRNASIKLTNEVILPYLEILDRDSAEGGSIKFSLSNISVLRNGLKEQYTSDRGTLKGYMTYNGIIELNESEKLYNLRYISAAYWHYCLALGYYNLSQSHWANVPGYGLKSMIQTQRDRPYNITGIRDKVYSDAIVLFRTSSKPYESDLFAMYILQDLYSADKSLQKLMNRGRILYVLAPFQVYESYLTVEAEVIGAEIFGRTFDSS